MFSRRTDWDLAPNALTKAAAQRCASGLPLFDLTESNPTRVGLGPSDAELHELISGLALSRYAPEPLGLPDVREALCTLIPSPCEPSRLVLTASTSEAYALLFKLLCEPGDEVLVPAPSYPLFAFLAGLESVRLVPYPSYEADGWHVDLEAFEAAIGPRTRAVVVVAPNNPTGALLRRHELAFIEERCARSGLALISDEVFAEDVAFAESDHVRTLAGDRAALTFVMGGLSKSCLSPGTKLAWTSVHGPRALVEEALARLEVSADAYLSCSTVAQRLAPLLMARRERWRGPLRQRMEANRQTLARLLQGSSGTLGPPCGGWSAVVRLPLRLSEESFCMELVAEDGVLVQPSYYYDFPAGRYVVASLLIEPASFETGARKLAARLAPDAGAP